MAHSFGKNLIKVYLSNGRQGYAMEVVDGYLMITDDPDAAARFLTERGAEDFYDEIRDLYNYIDRDAYIVKASLIKMNSL